MKKKKRFTSRSLGQPIRATYILSSISVNVWVSILDEDEVFDQLIAEDYGLTDFNKLGKRYE